jgi:hypothetical protein
MFYLLFAIMLVPWALLFVGGFRRMLRIRHIYGRLQCYGAAFMFLFKLAHMILFAPQGGSGATSEPEWAYWFVRAEWGAFTIGMLFFGMGYFLDRRPRPGYVPWPAAQRRLALGGMLLGMGLAGLATVFAWGDDFAGYSLGLPRLILALGFYPFAFAYEEWSRRDYSAPPISRIPI